MLQRAARKLPTQQARRWMRAPGSHPQKHTGTQQFARNRLISSVAHTNQAKRHKPSSAQLFLGFIAASIVLPTVNFLTSASRKKTLLNRLRELDNNWKSIFALLGELDEACSNGLFDTQQRMEIITTLDTFFDHATDSTTDAPGSLYQHYEPHFHKMEILKRTDALSAATERPDIETLLALLDKHRTDLNAEQQTHCRDRLADFFDIKQDQLPMSTPSFTDALKVTIEKWHLYRYLQKLNSYDPYAHPLVFGTNKQREHVLHELDQRLRYCINSHLLDRKEVEAISAEIYRHFGEDAIPTRSTPPISYLESTVKRRLEHKGWVMGALSSLKKNEKRPWKRVIGDVKLLMDAIELDTPHARRLYSDSEIVQFKQCVATVLQTEHYNAAVNTEVKALEAHLRLDEISRSSALHDAESTLAFVSDHFEDFNLQQQNKLANKLATITGVDPMQLRAQSSDLKTPCAAFLTTVKAYNLLHDAKDRETMAITDTRVHYIEPNRRIAKAAKRKFLQYLDKHFKTLSPADFATLRQEIAITWKIPLSQLPSCTAQFFERVAPQDAQEIMTSHASDHTPTQLSP